MRSRRDRGGAGVDVLWIGHFDLTNSWGSRAQFDHPDYLAAVDRIVAAARRHGKPAGFLALDDDWARRYHAKGFRVMAYGLDSQLLQSALQARDRPAARAGSEPKL